MIVDTVEAFAVQNPPPSFGGRYFVMVKVTTRDGVTGWGEAYGATLRAHQMTALIEDLADQYLVGHDARRVEDLFRRAYGRGFTQRPDVTTMAALSALEIACWDIVGRHLNQSVHDLLGGRVRDRVRAYTYLYPRDGDTADVYVDADTAAERAADMVDAGFTAVKFDPAGPYSAHGPYQPSLRRLDVSEAMVAAVRDAVGDRADILFGTHGQFTAAGAVRLARRLEAYDPLWFEEPVPPDDIAAMAEVARGCRIPIAAGERLTTVHEFARLLEARAVSIVQCNLARAGGLLQGKKIAAIAEAFSAQIAPHCYNGPVGAAANLALAACTPNLLVLETILGFDHGLHRDLLSNPLQMHEGFVVVPDGPGLGVDVDEDVVRAHPYTGRDLHLSMADAPIEDVDPLHP